MTRIWLTVAALALAACGRSPVGGGFRGISMKTLDGSREVSLASCSTDKCLTVYVAPWCHYCRAATPFIRQLPAALREKGIETRIVVGEDQAERLRDYARSFGGGALIDADHALDPGGVPHFYISDGRGEIVRQIAGLPPSPEELLAWILQDKARS